MILYLTHNDQPSGVYRSQVAEVVEHLNSLGGPRVRLVALVSLRGFFASRRTIKGWSASSIVLPMVPTMRRWKWNALMLALLCRALRPSGIMARGPFAAWMALRMRRRSLVRRVCFDGRGAYAAEWEEYRVIDDAVLVAQVRQVEREAVLEADFRLAVSHALVQHWREHYGCTAEKHVVVPCTLARSFEQELPSGERTSDGTTRFVYSGSAAGWQSFGLLRQWTARLMEMPGTSIVFMSPADPVIAQLDRTYPGRVERTWAGSAEEVRQCLAQCDMGVLVREESLTNRVASPTKFAEYLACGLPVLISAHLGDLTAMVAEHGLGMVVEQDASLDMMRPTDPALRAQCRAFALAHFTKSAHRAAYEQVLRALAE